MGLASPSVLTNETGFFGACACADYDNDGWLDLFITDAGASFAGKKNNLYHNNGNGTFAKIISGQIANDVGVGFNAVWGDYDNDGFLDLFVTAFESAQNRLYRNNRHGTFTEITSGPMLPNPPGSLAQGAIWGDYDNDGCLDLLWVEVPPPADLTNAVAIVGGDGL